MLKSCVYCGRIHERKYMCAERLATEESRMNRNRRDSEQVAIRNYNEVLNVACRKWTEYFEKKGFRSCILKGQSNARLYPEKLVRNAGDIDILVMDPKAEDAFESRRNVINVVRGIWPSCVVQYHHIEIPPVNGIPVEIHYLPVVAFSFFNNRRLQRYFWKHRNGCISNSKGFFDYDPQANLIFQMYHIFKHLIIEGVGLRQVIDYFFLLKSTSREERDAAASHLQDFGLKRFAGALMYVLQKCCGLEDEYFLVQPNPKIGKYFLDEIFRGGNFGRYDNRFDKKARGRIHNFLMISRVALRNFRFFPIDGKAHEYLLRARLYRIVRKVLLKGDLKYGLAPSHVTILP